MQESYYKDKALLLFYGDSYSLEVEDTINEMGNKLIKR